MRRLIRSKLTKARSSGFTQRDHVTLKITRRSRLAARLSTISLLLPASLVAVMVIGVKADPIYWPAPAVHMLDQSAARKECFQNLTAIMSAVRTYAMDNAGQFPASFEQITNDLAGPAVLFCPADGSRVAPTNWSGLDLAKTSYDWVATTNDVVPDSIACRCRVHEHVAWTDGSSHAVGRFKPGWPEVIASPMGQFAEPGRDVTMEVRIAPDASPPLFYQWRREEMYFVTNSTFIENPEVPRTGSWVTNIITKFIVSPLPAETNASLVLRRVATNHTGIYSVAVSNSVGVAVSSRAGLRVEPGAENFSSSREWQEAACVNNLRQIAVCARLWSEENRQPLPSQFDVMLNPYALPVFGWPAVFYCRADTNRPAPADWSKVDFANTSYKLSPAISDLPYDVYCRCSVHGFYAQLDGAVMTGPLFAGIRITNDNVTEVKFRVFAGRSNLLETSTDLVNWTPVIEYGPFDLGDFSIEKPVDSPRRFYRLRLQ